MKKVFDSEFSQVLAEIYIKASEDAAFRERLMQDGAAVLREYNVEIPEDFEVSFEEECRIGLPLPPIKELSDESLEGVAGGGLSEIGDWISDKFHTWHDGRDSKDDQKSLLKVISSVFKGAA